MEKFLFFENADGDASCLPARKLVDMEIDDDGTDLMMRFNIPLSSASTDSGEGFGEYAVTLVVSDNTGKEVMEAISEEIRFGKNPFITIANDTDSEYVHASLTGVATLPATA